MTRPGDGLDVSRLARWMTETIPDLGPEPVTATIVRGGRSNLTYFVDQGPRRWVLRRPPRGTLLPSAHDMQREVRVLRALRDTRVPVPDVLAYCADAEVVGAPFYLMSFVPGEVLRTRADTARLAPEQRAAVSEELIQALAGIHTLPWRDLGLAGLGRGEGYLVRQIHRWREQWRRSQTRELPELERLADWLRARVVDSGPPALVHGDFRLDNLIVRSAPRVRVEAVLDWEMSTIGDPLADLALLLVYWPDPADTLPPPSVAPQISNLPGLATRQHLVERYSRLAQTELDGLSFYVSFAYFKLAVILEGVYRRAGAPDASQTDAADLRDEVVGLVERGWAAIAPG